MSLVLSRLADVESLPAVGSHVARCCQIIDLGRQWDARRKASRPMVLIGWELPLSSAAGTPPPIVQRRYAKSLDENSNLLDDLNSWRGREFTAEEYDGFDLQKIAGETCLITVSHSRNVTAAGRRNARAKVTAVGSLAGSFEPPPAMHPVVIYDIDRHDEKVYLAFPDYLKRMIDESDERNYARRAAWIDGDEEQCG